MMQGHVALAVGGLRLSLVSEQAVLPDRSYDDARLQQVLGEAYRVPPPFDAA